MQQLLALLIKIRYRRHISKLDINIEYVTMLVDTTITVCTGNLWLLTAGTPTDTIAGTINRF
jgi:hypothetical protein